jgi:hypothetical protein
MYPELVRGTARAFEHRDSETPLNTLQEGILSIGQAIALLSAEKVDGFTQDQLLEAIIEGGLPNKLALSAPMGFLGPTVLRGQFVPDIIQATDERKVKLNPSFIKELAIRHHQYQLASLHISQVQRAVSSQLGYGCPVGRRISGKKSGVEELSEAFLHVYKSLG